jgi:hypothetical protein
MQTGNGLRADGSIEASDIVFYLCSRHGLTVDECTVQDLILRQLAGPTTQAEKPVLDLCQFVALLLIPKFLEACQDKDLSQKLLHPFVTTLQSFQDDQGKLSRDALREMLANYDEFVTDDELLDDMIAIIDGSLLDALSSDVGIYDLSWKNHYTTHLEDATAVEKDSVEKAPNHAVPFHRFFTASFIDYSADTYRRPLYVACLFACGIINYFAYVFGTDDGSWAEVNCGKMSELVCGLVQGLVSWAAIMVQLTTLGIFFIAFGSLGNGLSTCKTWLKFMGSVLSIGVIYLTTITPYFVVSQQVRRNHQSIFLLWNSQMYLNLSTRMLKRPSSILQEIKTMYMKTAAIPKSMIRTAISAGRSTFCRLLWALFSSHTWWLIRVQSSSPSHGWPKALLFLRFLLPLD